MADDQAELYRLRGGLWAVTQRAETAEAERDEAVAEAQALTKRVRDLERRVATLTTELGRLRANPFVRLGAPVRSLRRKVASVRGGAARPATATPARAPKTASPAWHSRAKAPGVPRFVGVLYGMSVAGFGPEC
ncbi:MAG: hypothetical protein JWN54_2280, partial [Mycobacterium sp.]|nr:hypothetical protein [Mycobacterium sp.]